jgi:hypothetical protein
MEERARTSKKHVCLRLRAWSPQRPLCVTFRLYASIGYVQRLTGGVEILQIAQLYPRGMPRVKLIIF